MNQLELVLLEQGERAALYARWPNVFTVAMGSLRYSMGMNRFLTDLHNAITDAHWNRNHSDG